MIVSVCAGCCIPSLDIISATMLGLPGQLQLTGERERNKIISIFFISNINRIIGSLTD